MDNACYKCNSNAVRQLQYNSYKDIQNRDGLKFASKMGNQLVNLKCIVVGADGDVGFASAIALLKGGAHTVYIQGLSKNAATSTAEKLNKLAKQCEWPGTVLLFQEGDLFDDLKSDSEQMKEISALVVNTSALLDFCAYFKSKGLPESTLYRRVSSFAEKVNNFIQASQDLQECHCKMNVIILGSPNNIKMIEPSLSPSCEKHFFRSESLGYQFIARPASKTLTNKFSINLIKHGFLVSNNILSCYEGLTREDVGKCLESSEKCIFFSSVELENVICLLASRSGHVIKDSTINMGD